MKAHGTACSNAEHKGIYTNTEAGRHSQAKCTVTTHTRAGDYEGTDEILGGVVNMSIICICQAASAATIIGNQRRLSAYEGVSFGVVGDAV